MNKMNNALNDMIVEKQSYGSKSLFSLCAFSNMEYNVVLIVRRALKTFQKFQAFYGYFQINSSFSSQF